MAWVASILQRFPELAIFLAMAIGFAIGRIKYRKFQLGGVAGSLLAALLISQLGVHIDDGFKAVFFPLFIYAVGYEIGPQFGNSLHRDSLREIALALFLAASGLLTVIAVAKLFALDKGLAAGIAAGGLTQSAIVGTADEAITRLGLPAAQTQVLRSNVALGYAVTYVFGVLGAVFLCTSLLPRAMRRDLHEDALQAERELAGSGAGAALARQGAPLGPEEHAAMPRLVGRAYRVQAGVGRSLGELEAQVGGGATIQVVERRNERMPIRPELLLEHDDLVFAAGRRDGVVRLAPLLGPEDPDAIDPALSIARRQVVFTAEAYNHMTLAQVQELMHRELLHGAYLASITRMGNRLPLAPQTRLQHGDVLELYGSEQDVARLSEKAGYTLVSDGKTDLVYLGLGVLVGILFGLVSVRLGGAPVSLGTGGGALLSGVLFGWLRAKRPIFGALPPSASATLKDLGLAGFVAAVGLGTGREALIALEHSGFKVFALGAVVTLVPMLSSMLFGRFVLGYRNVAMFGGALSGANSSNFAFGEVIEQAESSAPAVPFAITYAVANVALTLLGPVIVALV
jgi:putative transport protein